MSGFAISGRRLEWDTDFFGVPIGQGEAASATEVEAIDLWAARENISCLYLLVPGGTPEAAQAAEGRGFEFVGNRMTLRRDLGADLAAPGVTGSDAARPVRPADVPALERIAATVHGDTRFYVDRHFPRASCDRLYQTWIRQSCQGWADHVLTAGMDGQPQGYITLHLRAPGEGAIGLAGVANEARRRGIGRALVDSALRWFRDRGTVRVSVATQTQNLPAVALYQHMGFVVSDLDTWFHKWR
jgi:ribosomal protein S18 acetylase RimI-like enzyme